DLVDEGLRIRQDSVVDEVRPVLTGLMELLVDLRGLLQIDVAVGVLRRVVELAQGRVTGAGVVPRIRALLGDIVELLVDTDVPIGLEFGQHGAESGAHDAAADQDDVNLFLLGGHLDSHSSSLTACIRLSDYSPPLHTCNPGGGSAATCEHSHSGCASTRAGRIRPIGHFGETGRVARHKLCNYGHMSNRFLLRDSLAEFPPYVPGKPPVSSP